MEWVVIGSVENL